MTDPNIKNKFSTKDNLKRKFLGAKEDGIAELRNKTSLFRLTGESSGLYHEEAMKNYGLKLKIT